MQAREYENAGTESGNQPEALVVEDDLFFSVRIETMLQKMGYAVFVATTHDAAVAQAQKRAPAIVIINFGGERTTPGETVKQIKALSPTTPVLGFVSHVWMPQVRPNAMAAGCDLLVANSALTMRLPQLVEKLLKNQPE